MTSAIAHLKRLACLLCFGALTLLAPVSHARAAGDDAPMFTLLPEFTPEQIAQPAWIRAKVYQPLMVSMDAVTRTLADAPLEDTPKANSPLIVFLPTPDGVFQRFSVVEAPIMEPALAAQFPNIKTYRGQGIDDPWATLRMDHTPQGFHAQVLTPTGRGAWYIDPFTDRDTVLHTSFYKGDLRRTMPWTCDVLGRNIAMRGGDGGAAERSSGTSLRTLRLAVAATVEYTAFHGGTVALGQAAIVTAINRVTGVYEREVAIRMVLVANNSSLVYTTAPDPYTNGNGSTMLAENQSNVDTVIGTANYDIGHVFSTGGGGVAGLGVVCIGGNKARGVTGSPAPTGDAFWIDYVAHEMGHQFDGNHTFNGTGGNCAGGNRNASTAYEPGSGSTIQAYAGICGADDLQPNSDAYFHTISYNEIRANIEAAASCGTASATVNTAPIVDAGANYTIPRQTPFTLTAIGSDANGDALTYCWEELALGAAQTLAATDNGASPLIRSFSPTTSPSRTVPRLATILSNTADPEEELPSLARTTWNWRCTVRDNRSGGGGVNEDNIVLTVSSAAGPFLVTYPNSVVSIGGPVTVTWNVAGTDSSPVNCANVKISLSTDGGNTFPTVLAASTPNDGSETVVLPAITTSLARLKIEAVGNIFFDLSNTNFSIFPVAPAVAFVSGGSNTIADTTGSGNANGIAEPGESPIVLTVPVKNSGSLAGTGLTGTLTSLTATASIISGVSAYPDLAPDATANNASPLTISISPSHPCGAPVNLRMSVSSAQGSSTFDFSIIAGTVTPAQTITKSWTGALPIPNNSTAGVNADLVVTGVGAVSDVNFRFDGSSCSTSSTSTTVGLNHSSVGDLVVTLTYIPTSGSPVSVVLMNRPGGTGNGGNNFCQTVLDDSGSSDIQSIVSSGAPWSGTFQPNSPLSAFNGLDANATWRLNVADLASTGSGATFAVRAFSLVFTVPGTSTCQPPGASTGACCLNTGACTITTGSGACAGNYRGDGTTCPPIPACAQASTCCLADGSCVVILVGQICNGSPRADSACPPTTACQQPVACCASDGTCTVVPPGEPCDGTPAMGSTCPPTPACPQPFACCASDGSCTVIPIGGTCNGFARTDSTCPPTTPCVQPFACCASDGSCSVIPPGGTCNGTAASGATCPPTPACAQPTTCCLADGSCTVIPVGGSCAGTVGGGSTCPPAIPCPPASGACCASNGSCSVLSVADCNAIPGAYQGDGIACTPTLCPQPVVGACCQSDGSCLSTTEAQCTVGIWSNATCTPTVCPQPTGACCQTDGSCLALTQASCTAGVWSSGSCSPNTCPQPQGTCCVASGSCTLTSQAACSGTWNGAGTACDPNPCPQPPQNCCRGTTCVSVASGSCTGTVAGSNSVVFAACGSGNSFAACCYADFDHNGTPSIDDLFLYFNAYFVGSPYAKYGGDGVASPAIDDLFLYMNAYFTGCAP